MKSVKYALSRRRLLRHAGTLGLASSFLGTAIAHSGQARAVSSPKPLPQRASGSRQNEVLIIGAGLAGLAAGLELQRSGHRVTVLEARARAGGRVRTIADPFADNLRSELGAVVFSGAYHMANRYIDELGLTRLPYANADLPALYHVRGRRFAVGSGAPVDWPYALTADEAELGPIGLVVELLAKTLPAEIGHPDAWRTQALRALDEVSLADYLRGQGASADAIRMIDDALYFGWRPEHASMLSVAMTDIGLFFRGAGMFVLEGGNQQLPNAMAMRLGDQIEYGVEVTDIEMNERGAQVQGRRAGESVTYQADHVVSTVPVPVMQAIHVRPSLPASKQTAMSRLPYHDILRVQIQVRSAFWREEGVSGAATTDLFDGRIDRQPYADVGETQARAILDGFFVGEDAERLADMDDAEVREWTVGTMRQVHPDLPRYLEGSVIKRWNRDPYTRGGWSWPDAGYVTEHLDDLRAPHGRLHFAGEHTSILRATMEGALRSGIRVARAIDAASGINTG